MLRSILFALSFLVLFSGCMKADEANCEYNECGYKAPQAEIQAVQDYLTANNIQATQHCSGLFYRVENPGTGARPNACSFVQVNYKGMFTNGTVFDQSSQGPASFYLSQVIQGWTNGIPQVKTGGRIFLYIPPSLGYGRDNYGTIPGNSILVFEVDLLAVR